MDQKMLIHGPKMLKAEASDDMNYLSKHPAIVQHPGGLHREFSENALEGTRHERRSFGLHLHGRNEQQSSRAVIVNKTNE